MLSSSINITDFPQNLPSYEHLAADDNEATKIVVDKNYLIQKQIGTFFENMGLEISTILSYLSIPTLINCARRFPEIDAAVSALIENSIYNRCWINRVARLGADKDADTAGTEATSYTTFLVIIGFGLLIPTGFRKIMSFLKNRKDLSVLREKLKDFRFKLRSKFFDLNQEQVQFILDNIHVTEKDFIAATEKINFETPTINETRMQQLKRLQEQAELDHLAAKFEEDHRIVHERLAALEEQRKVIAEALTQERFLLNDYQWHKIKYDNMCRALKLQFGEMSQADFRSEIKEINEKKLAPHIFPKNDVPNSWWTRFCNQTHWFRGELGRYMKPLALAFVIPGIIKTLQASQQIAAETGCDMTAVFTDQCGAVQEVDVMSQEIWIWMWVSFPLLFFYAGMTFLNGATYPFQKLEGARNWFYEKIHKPYEKWCTREDLWLHQEYVWRLVSPFLLSGTMIFSIWRSLGFADRYAYLVGCESLLNTIEMTYQNRDSLECTAATQGMIIATFVGAAEIGKFYLLYVLEFYGVNTLTYILGKIIDFKKHLPVETVNKDMDAFIEQDNLGMKVASAAIFVSGSVNLIPAKKLGDEIFHEGLKVSMPLPSLNETLVKINSTSATDAFLHEICPEDDFVSLLNSTFPNVHIPQNFTLQTIYDFLNKTASWKSPVVIINNNTLVYTLAEACLSAGVISSLFMNILQNDPFCNELVTIRALGAAIAFFYLNASVTGATAYFLTDMVLRINYFCKKLCCYQAKLERESEEVSTLTVKIVNDNEEKKEQLNDLSQPLLQTRPRSLTESISRKERFWNWLSRKKTQDIRPNDYKHAGNSWNLFSNKNQTSKTQDSKTPPRKLSARSPSIV